LESTQEPPRCNKCAGGLRHSFSCCGQRLCTDCLLDHVSESSGHEPPLPEETLAFAAVFDTSNPQTARLHKVFWLTSRYKRDDPRLGEAIGNIDNIKFT